MSLKVTRVTEHGYKEALRGLALNKKQKKDMSKVARLLAGKGLGHDKFMRQIAVWAFVKAPLYWWKQMDQYNFIVTQSESTMHTILKKPVNFNDFSGNVPEDIIDILNKYIQKKEFNNVISLLPSSYYQTRLLFTNYAQIDTIIKQRSNHKLEEWHQFIDQIVAKLKHKELLLKEK